MEVGDDGEGMDEYYDEEDEEQEAVLLNQRSEPSIREELIPVKEVVPAPVEEPMGHLVETVELDEDQIAQRK